MPKAEAEPTTKITILVYTSDYLRLQDLHPRTGAAKAIRELVRQYVSRVEQKVAAKQGNLVGEIDV